MIAEHAGSLTVRPKGVSYAWFVSRMTSVATMGVVEYGVIVSASETERKPRTVGPVAVLGRSPRLVGLVKDYAARHDYRTAQGVATELGRFAGDKAERVAGDLCADEVWAFVQRVGSELAVVLIEGPARHRFVDRLGYLSMSTKATIAFFSYRPRNLVTSLLEIDSQGFGIDAYTMLKLDSDTTLVRGPFPGFDEGSETRAFFIRPRFEAAPVRASGSIWPVRIDIFCPGQDEAKVLRKVETIRGILESATHSTPVQIGTGVALVPLVIVDARRKLEIAAADFVARGLRDDDAAG